MIAHLGYGWDQPSAPSGIARTVRPPRVSEPPANHSCQRLSTPLVRIFDTPNRATSGVLRQSWRATRGVVDPRWPMASVEPRRDPPAQFPALRRQRPPWRATTTHWHGSKTWISCTAMCAPALPASSTRKGGTRALDDDASTVDPTAFEPRATLGHASRRPFPYLFRARVLSASHYRNGNRAAAERPARRLPRRPLVALVGGRSTHPQCVETLGLPSTRRADRAIVA